MAIDRFLNWITQDLNLKVLLMILLLLIAIGSLGYDIADHVQGLDVHLLMRFVILSLAISWLFAKINISGWLTGILTTILGILYVFVAAGDLLPPLIALGQIILKTGWESLFKLTEVTTDSTSLYLAYAELLSTTRDLVNSLWYWFRGVLYQQELYNERVVILIWGMILWWLTSWAGWMLRRKNEPILGVLPTGIVLSVSLTYTDGSIDALIPFLISSLLLMVANTFIQVENHWQSLGLSFPDDLSLKLSATTILIVIGVVMVSVLAPSISIRDLVSFVRQRTQPQVETIESLLRYFGLEQQSSENGGLALWGGMPRHHTFQSPPEFLEEVVMSVKITGGLQSFPENGRLPLYWRSLTYDYYTGSGWLSSNIDTQTYQAGQEANNPDSPYHILVQQDIRLTNDKTNYLYAAGMIVSADDEFRISWRSLPESVNLGAHPRDFFGGSIDEASYQVQSLIPTVSDDDLKNVSDAYPAWILERYLQLPVSVSERVVKLAQGLTIDDLTAYEKARSLEVYLRGFEYSLDLEAFPEGQEMVDYFIFDLQKGYCDYYATSMVVMARAIGLPARLAIGYSRGEYDRVNDRYVIIEANAHSWPEIYFPEIGWIPFEPTAGRVKDLSFQDQWAAEVESVQPLGRSAKLNRQSILLLILLGGSFALISIHLLEFWHINRMVPSKAVITLYHRLYGHGRSLKVPAKGDQTPIEFSTNLQDRITSLSKDTYWQKIIEQAVPEIQEFTRVYALVLYSPFGVTKEDQKEIYARWRNLRQRLWLARLCQWISRTRSQ